jgi:hypothetical protein
MKLFRLDRYVVCRDPMGNVLEIITKEDLSHDTVPDHVRALLPAGHQSKDPNSKAHSTHGCSAPRRQVLEGPSGSPRHHHPRFLRHVPIGKSPWIPLRWSKIDGEDYGRGYVEEYIGDLKSLEALSRPS